MVLLVYYKAIEIAEVKINGSTDFQGENLFIAIALTESLSSLLALFFLGIIPIAILRLLIPVIGVGILALLLSQKYSLGFVLRAVTIRLIFYLINTVALLLGFIT